MISKLLKGEAAKQHVDLRWFSWWMQLNPMKSVLNYHEIPIKSIEIPQYHLWSFPNVFFSTKKHETVEHSWTHLTIWKTENTIKNTPFLTPSRTMVTPSRRPIPSTPGAPQPRAVSALSAGATGATQAVRGSGLVLNLDAPGPRRHRGWNMWYLLYDVYAWYLIVEDIKIYQV